MVDTPKGAVSSKIAPLVNNLAALLYYSDKDLKTAKKFEEIPDAERKAFEKKVITFLALVDKLNMSVEPRSVDTAKKEREERALNVLTTVIANFTIRIKRIRGDAFPSKELAIRIMETI